MKSIGTRLAIFVSILLVVSAIVMGALAYFHMRSLAKENLEHEVHLAGMLQSNRIAEWIGAKRRIIEAQANVLFEPNPQALMLRAKNAGDFGPLFAGFPDKRMMNADPSTPLPPGFDPTVRPWYKFASERDGVGITPPFMSVSDKKLVVTIAMPIRRDGSLYAVMGANVILETLVESVLSIRLAGDSHAFLVDKDGKVIAHRKTDMVLKPIADELPGLTAERIAAMAANGTLTEMTEGGQSRLVVLQPVKGTDWFLGLSVDEKAALAPLRAMLLTSLLTIIGIIAAGIVLMRIGVGRILAALTRLRDALNDVAQGEGDLTVRLAVQSQDEVGQAASAFNRFIERLHGMFREVGQETQAVDRQVSLVAGKTTRVVEDFERQTEELGATAAAIEEVTVGVAHIADTAKDAQGVMQTADTESEAGARAVRQVTEEIGRIASVIERLAQVVGGLGNRSDEIASIVGAIKDVAERTNLLALNAAIEAARAGEQGRGFAVVADEVRNLAERTRESTSEIGAMIQSIQNEIGAAVTGMDDARRVVAEGVELGSKASASIGNVRTQMTHVVTRMQEIADATAEQASAMSDMARRAAHVSTMIETNSVALNEAHGALTESGQRTQELGRIVGRFKL